MKLSTRLLVSSCFLVHIFSFSMNNSTALVTGALSCVSPVAENSHVCLVPFGRTSFNPYDGCALNRPQRRALEKKHKEKHISFETRARKASEVIDKYLEVDKSYNIGEWLVRWTTGCNPGRWIMGYKDVTSLTGEQITKNLAFINALTNNALKNSKLLSLIMKENSYIRQVVEALPNKMIEEWENVKGSNIDMFQNETVMFSEIAHEQAVKSFTEVNQYYTNQFYLDLELPVFVRGLIVKNSKERTLGSYFFEERKYYEDNNYLSEIYLRGHDYSVEYKSLRISENGRYLRSMDSSKKEIVWDMITARMVNNQKTIAALKWTSGSTEPIDSFHSDYFERGDWIFSKDGDYFAARGEYRKYVGMTDDKLVFLCARPTLAFRLCQLAIMNSKNDRGELNALLKSKTLKSVKGFQKDNIVVHIKNLLKDLSARK